jgi:sugar lactone lactonase YvrE
VVRINPDGSQQIITQSPAAGSFADTDEARRFVDGTLPNGLAFASNGDILIANFGTDCLERMTRDGVTKLLYDTVDGEPIGKVNFVFRDTKNRFWVTITTMQHEWQKALSPNVRPDGRVLLYEEGKGIRIVAEGVHHSNECRTDANEEYLYVAQTAGRNVVRYKIRDNGDLCDREIFGPGDHGRHVDGIAFDSYGNLWGTHVFTDSIFAITPEGELRFILEDTTPDEVARLDAGFRGDQLTQEFLLTFGGDVAKWCASITFGGPDLKTVYVGSLRQDSIPHFRSPVAGLPLAHWNE